MDSRCYTAIETADVTLVKDDLGKIAETIRLGQRMLGIIHFNIGFALSLKALFLVLTLLGHASLWMAITADTGATLLVVANALRLLRHQGAATSIIHYTAHPVETNKAG